MILTSFFYQKQLFFYINQYFAYQNQILREISSRLVLEKLIFMDFLKNNILLHISYIILMGVPRCPPVWFKPVRSAWSCQAQFSPVRRLTCSGPVWCGPSGLVRFGPVTLVWSSVQSGLVWVGSKKSGHQFLGVTRLLGTNGQRPYGG